jgi:CHAD domain-containing protein
MAGVTLSGEQRYAEAAAQIIGARGRAVFAFTRKRVLDVGDIEGVHDMRVATRRLRAGLEVFGPALDRKRTRRVLHEVKALAEALGERRDRDVQLERLAELREDCAGAEAHAIELLEAELREEQRRANAQLEAALRHAKRTRLRHRLRRLAR